MDEVIVINKVYEEVLIDSNVGPKGKDGKDGFQNVFIQDTQPVAAFPYLWLQTGLAGNGFTMWFEDGL